METKFYVPRLRLSLVPRPRLSELLSRGSQARLTLISAPAGFGKTTLLTAWLAAAGTENRSVAWLSLDASDNEPSTFWTYVITALQSAVPGLGASALVLLQHTRPPPVEAVLTMVLNELATVENTVDLILDDFHLVDSPDVRAGVVFLLEHLPPQVRLVISTRADPPLPLARLRVRGELVEIRAGDLRFTPDEATAYLNGVMGLALTARDLAALADRTEGWIAALQLAALSMQGRDDVAAFIAGFAGDDRYVVDYLVEEVLHRQPEPVQTFLLSTAVLDRLSGPLCDAVTGQRGGAAMLESLDRGNLFLVPLDDRRRWFRYHHLFADVLRARLRDEQPDRVPGLHRQASAWFEENGERGLAIEHSLAGQDVERAAQLVELAIPAARRDRQEATMRRWLEALPDELIRVRPVLGVTYAGSLLSTGELDIEARLQDAERWLAPPPGAREAHRAAPTGKIVVDEQEYRRLPNQIAMYRAGRALIVGDLTATTTHARRALELAAAEDHLGRGGAQAILGLVHWARGDLDAAYRWFADGTSSLEKAGHLSDVVGNAVTLGDIRIAQGRLREAMSAYEWGLAVAAERGTPVRWGAADMHVGMSVLLSERNDLPAATQHLLTSRELGEHTGMPQNRYRWPAAMARIREAEGDPGGALDLLEQAERLFVPDFSPDVRPILARKARLWIAQGQLGAAVSWAREKNLSAADDLSYLREFEHLTLARLLLARSAAEGATDLAQQAGDLLARLLSAAETGGRTGSVLEVLVLQALTRRADGDTTGALALVERALALAEPEGWVRVFVAEGPPMAELLRSVVSHLGPSDYVRQLLDACGDDGRTVPADVPRGSTARSARGALEPLSTRERAVLRLLGSDLDGPQIARELVVSLNTVRTHTKNIYSKLGVNSRRAAVTRAQELGLLGLTREHR